MSTESDLQFTCQCEKLEGIKFACMKIFKLIQRMFGNNFNYEKMAKQYRDISQCGMQCDELKKYDADIEKDLLRTFPKVPQFANNSRSNSGLGHHPVNMSFSVQSQLNDS